MNEKTHRTNAWVVYTVLIACSSLGLTQRADARHASIRNECYTTLAVLGPSLVKMQITTQADSNFGGLICPEHALFHTRAAEAVYPLAVLYKHTGDRKYASSAVALGDWLIRQQSADGGWLETPWTWTGTTADQLLMMSLAYPILEPLFTAAEKAAWKASIEAAARFLVRVMNSDFATINYCATTPASLAATNLIFPNPAYVRKGRELSRQVLSKMNDDGFIEGEAARVGKEKYGVDPAYEMDMSFWGLTLYARLTGDTLVQQRIREALATHLFLVYPNGIIDGSWGARCYKWTTFGSKTADGSQILFSLYAGEDARYRTAAIRNLEYLRTMIRGGVIGNGPHYFDMCTTPPCNYPTFARAKNLALAVELGEQQSGPLPPLPTEIAGMLKVYPTVNIAVARTENFLATISAYQYVDIKNWGEGRYSQFPSGGSACNIWVKDFGLLQTSSPTKYVRGEVIHMPEIKETIRPHTPRIEYSDSGRLITNLYDRSGIMSVRKKDRNCMTVSVAGEMRDGTHTPNGVSYRLTHTLEKSAVQKSVEVKYHDKWPEISIVEPVVFEEGMMVVPIDARRVRISYKKKNFLFELVSGDAVIELGVNKEQYWQPFPALRTYPIVLKVPPPEHPFEGEQYRKKIVFRLSIAE